MFALPNTILIFYIKYASGETNLFGIIPHSLGFPDDKQNPAMQCRCLVYLRCGQKSGNETTGAMVSLPVFYSPKIYVNCSFLFALLSIFGFAL
jgi:hypothetical protein